jgi:hypothetical protein
LNRKRLRMLRSKGTVRNRGADHRQRNEWGRRSRKSGSTARATIWPPRRRRIRSMFVLHNMDDGRWSRNTKDRTVNTVTRIACPPPTATPLGTQPVVVGNRPLSSCRRRPYQPHTQSFLSTGGLSVVPIEHKMGSKKNIIYIILVCTYTTSYGRMGTTYV